MPRTRRLVGQPPPELLASAPRAAMPRDLVPMLATPGSLPRSDDGWAYEFKWDGFRAMARWDGRALALRSRNRREILGEFPELADLGRALAAPAIIDGEIVAFDASGRPSFNRLQNRGDSPRPAIAFLVFDLLWWRDRSLMPLPYVERRAALEALRLRDERWSVPPFVLGDGHRLLDVARERGLEGLIAKRADGTYVPGIRRRDDWLKIKLIAREDFAVCGYLPGSDSFTGTMGSLVLAYHAQVGGRRVLRYAGKVGTGFSMSDRALLKRVLDRERVPSCPVAAAPRFPVQPVWSRPRLVAEVAFTEMTPDGYVRHPSFQGLREDKDVADVIDPRPRD